MSLDEDVGNQSRLDGPEIGNFFLSATFSQLELGKELLVVETLKKSGHKHLFKSLGQFDLVSLLETQVLESPFLYVAEPHITSSRAVNGYKFSGEARNISPQNLEKWLSDYPLVGFTLLELDKWLYSKGSGSGTPVSASLKIIERILSKLPEEKQNDIAFFGGFGRSELYSLVRTNDLRIIWELVEIVRSLSFSECFPDCQARDEKLHVFVRTRTLPLVSYNFLKKPSDCDPWSVEGIVGNTSASIRISCPSGFESYISNFFNRTEYQVDNIFGGEDINIYTRNPVATTELLVNILNFRSKWIESHGAPVKTQTVIHSPLNNKQNPITYELISTPPAINIPQEVLDVYPSLANRSKLLMFKVVSLYMDRLNHILVHDMIPYMSYLQYQLDGLAKALTNEDKKETFIFEGLIREALESAEIGLAQRSNSSFDIAQGESFLPLSFGDGIFSNLVSLEVLINNIFDIWNKSRKETEKDKIGKWHGFAVFSDCAGFKVRWGEVMYFPLTAATDPFSDEGNWLTLTHEISHAISLRLKIESNLDASCRSLYKNYVQVNSNINDMLLSYQYFTDEVFELFGHWYDFTHFYARDCRSFLKNIWRSWIVLPVVNINMVEYFTRSYIIYITNNFNDIIETRKQGSSVYNSFLDKKFYEHNELLLEMFPLFRSITAEMESIIGKIKGLAHVYIPIVKKFKDDYEDIKFSIAINSSYKDLDNHVQSILDGKVVTTEIENCYVLIKNIAKKNDFKEMEPRINTALLLSLRNQQSFLEDE